VTLQNKLPNNPPDQQSFNLLQPIIEGFNFNQLHESARVGLHPQLVAVNNFTDDGASVGFNRDSTVAPGGSETYTWYAGDPQFSSSGSFGSSGSNSAGSVQAPIEFGATSLRDWGDAIKHGSHGAGGALVIEPQGSEWTTDPGTNASATVTDSRDNLLFREFVVVVHDDLTMDSDFPFPDPGGFRAGLQNGTDAVLQNHGGDEVEDAGQKGINLRTEVLSNRLGQATEFDTDASNQIDQPNDFSSTASLPGCGGACGDPVTPVFTAHVGTPVRFRLVYPAGHNREHGFTIHGHNFQEEPWTNNSTVLGSNPNSELPGALSNLSVPAAFNLLMTAGGRMG
ncbi:MAG: copper oxidase, partial [Blastocatellia bacterium]